MKKSDEIKVLTECIIDATSKNGFCGIVVPSLTGKTQLAFSLNGLVFYFSFDNRNQTIYQCFTSYNLELFKAISEDFSVALKFRTGKLDEEENSLASKRGLKVNKNESLIFDLDNLNEIFDAEKSRLLGFLLALVKNFLNDANLNCTSWMEVFTAERSFSYGRVNISEFKRFMNSFDKSIMKKITIVLDEFPTSTSSSGTENMFKATFCRNIIRSVNLNCIVMGTNTQVTNIIGNKFGGGSGSDNFLRFWCNVVTKLPKINFEFLEEHFRLDEKLSILKSILVHILSSELADDFISFLIGQIKSSRPGISHFICQAIGTLCDSEHKTNSFKELLYKITTLIQDSILNRKDILRLSQSRIGSMQLMLKNLIQQEDLKNLIIDTSHFINAHLFYVINPSITESSYFALHTKKINFVPKFFFCKDNVEVPLTFSAYFPSPRLEFFSYLSVWGNFSRDEIVSRIQSEPFITSVLAESINNENSSILENTEAVTSNFRIGEQIAMQAIIHASHTGGFDGVPADFFVKSVVLNCFQDYSSLHVSFDNQPILNSFLAKIIVPYLGPSNEKWPSFFARDSRIIGLGQSFRSENNDEIDGHFDILPIRNSIYVCHGLFESKLHCSDLQMAEFKLINETTKNYALKYVSSKSSNGDAMKTAVILQFTFCRVASLLELNSDFDFSIANITINAYIFRLFENDITIHSIGIVHEHPIIVSIIIPFLWDPTDRLIRPAAIKKLKSLL